MSDTEHARVCADGARLTDAIHRLAAHALRTGAAGDLVRQHLALTPEETALAGTAPLTGPFTQESRLDGFRTADRTAFVEYNSHSPVGIVSQDLLCDIWAGVPVMETFRREYRVEAVPGCRWTADSLVSAWRTGGAPGGEPHVAVVDWESGFAWEFEALRAELQGRGVPAVVCSPDDLHYETGRGLYTRDPDGRRRPITVVHRRVLLNDLLSRYGHTLTDHPLTRAWAAGACVMVNPYTSHLAHKKSVLALLTDPRAGDLLPEPEAAAARELVPWTRLVRAGTTTCPDGHRTDLMTLARDRRDRLVLKPNDDYGGRGVLFGWETTDREWQAALGRALLSPHVVQERVTIPTASYPVLVRGRCGRRSTPRAPIPSSSARTPRGASPVCPARPC
ncbi:hypothetical protein ACFQ2B_31435 [Streptomyces stramineus]